jgi:hypothetical protein
VLRCEISNWPKSANGSQARHDSSLGQPFLVLRRRGTLKGANSGCEQLQQMMRRLCA